MFTDLNEKLAQANQSKDNQFTTLTENNSQLQAQIDLLKNVS